MKIRWLRKKLAIVGRNSSCKITFIKLLCRLYDPTEGEILLNRGTTWRSAKKLFHLLIEKNMTNAQLLQEAGFSANIITRLKRGRYISLESVESICRVLNCGVDDILEFIPEDNGGKENG